MLRFSHGVSTDQLQEFVPRLLLGAKGTEHGAGDGQGVLLFDSTLHHAQVTRFHHHGYAVRIQLAL